MSRNQIVMIILERGERIVVVGLTLCRICLVWQRPHGINRRLSEVSVAVTVIATAVHTHVTEYGCDELNREVIQLRLNSFENKFIIPFQ